MSSLKKESRGDDSPDLFDYLSVFTEIAHDK